MKVSLNTLKSLSPNYDITSIGKNPLIKKIGSQLGGIDEIIDLGAKYEGTVIVKVVECEKHPNADKLSLCRVDDGGVVQGVERGEDGLVQVVCGAPNVRAGMLAAWLPPGATVPDTFGKEPFVLEARELRGKVSNGMLASPKELDLGDSHAGILELEDSYQPGSSFAEAFGLKDDLVLDIENKMFTHRPDCFGFLGIARELAGIQGQPFKSPEWYVTQPEFSAVSGEPLQVDINNELPELVPRFTAIAMSDIKVGPSPTWLVVELAKVGQKSINNIVDYTNWFMLLTGQPLHAYDYDKVKSLSENEATIVVRHPREGEKIKLLNGKEITPRSEAIMIATDKQLIGVGGVMGGADTEVDDHTTRIILECATFDMYSVRRTSMEHGLFTDAVTRFTKGQSPLQNLAVLNKIVNEIQASGNSKVASKLADIKNDKLEVKSEFGNFKVNDGRTPSVFEWGSVSAPISVTNEFINARLGLSLTPDEIIKLLNNVEVKAYVEHPSYPNEIDVHAPFWRTDIEIAEDVVEEVGRLYGYDKLPLELPVRDIAPARRDPILDLKARIRSQLSQVGANEVLTYSFVHGDLMRKVGQDPDRAFQVANALSPDLQYYRVSLLPSLLDKVHANVKVGHDHFAIFEIGKAHVQGESDPDDPNVPKEVNSLAFVYTSKNNRPGAPYYQARNYLSNLLAANGSLTYINFEALEGADLYKNPWLEQMTAPFEPGRSAVLRDNNGMVWGVVGEFKSSVRKNLKLPAYSSGFEIDPLLLTLVDETANAYVPLPRFPEVRQDITLKVDAQTPYKQVQDLLWDELIKLHPMDALPILKPLNVYQPEDNKAHKNLTFRLKIASYERTLTDEEVNNLLDKAVEAMSSQISVERV